MEHCIPSTGAILALLIVAVTVTVDAGASELAYAAPVGAARSSLDKEKAGAILHQADDEMTRKKVRKENDEKSKAREPLYSRQAGSLAKHYRETAAMVARQGGDPKPLLDATAYFESQSK